MSIYKKIESDSTTHRVLQLNSPVTLEATGELVCANHEDVQQAVAKARAAQPAWEALGFKARADLMKAMCQVVLKRKDDIIDMVISETGKAYADAFAMEVFSCCDSLDYYARNSEKFLRPVKRKVAGLMGLTKRVEIIYQPLGVVGIITPWNGPFVLAVNQGVQALMGGNSVVVKGSEVTPHSTKLSEEMFHEAGVPADVYQVLMGDGETGADLIDSDIDKISFTGSVATGRKVGEACGRLLMPCTLELGGKDAMIVCEDTNLDRAVDGAIKGACMNTGHYCCGTERIYVMAGIYEQFVSKASERVKALRQGRALGLEEDVGAVFWDKQMEIIESHVQEAKQAGAKVLVGGERNPDEKGLYYLPTVMTEVNHDMRIMREETFGPILCIMKVNSIDEALQLANDSDYGLSGTVWCGNPGKAKDIARKMQTGNVCLNDMTVTYGIPAAPFGGIKNSGVGLVNGDIGVRNYCQAKPIVIEKRPKGKMQNAYPNTKATMEGMAKFTHFLWGTKIGQALVSLFNKA